MKKLQKELLRKYKEIAAKHNCTLKEVTDVEMSIWRMVSEKMAEGDREDFSTFHNIYLAGLGTFYASEGLHKFVTMNRKKKELRDVEST